MIGRPHHLKCEARTLAFSSHRLRDVGSGGFAFFRAIQLQAEQFSECRGRDTWPLLLPHRSLTIVQDYGLLREICVYISALREYLRDTLLLVTIADTTLYE